MSGRTSPHRSRARRRAAELSPTAPRDVCRALRREGRAGPPGHRARLLTPSDTVRAGYGCFHPEVGHGYERCCRTVMAARCEGETLGVFCSRQGCTSVVHLRVGRPHRRTRWSLAHRRGARSRVRRTGDPVAAGPSRSMPRRSGSCWGRSPRCGTATSGGGCRWRATGRWRRSPPCSTRSPTATSISPVSWPGSGGSSDGTASSPSGWRPGPARAPGRLPSRRRTRSWTTWCGRCPRWAACCRRSPRATWISGWTCARRTRTARRTRCAGSS